MTTHSHLNHSTAMALTLAVFGLLTSGCASPAPAPPAPGAPSTPPITAPLFPADSGAVQHRQADATPNVPLVVQVIAYRITLPAGAVSRGEDFWKHVEENAVDVPTYELLFKNGVRVGVAASSEWDYLRGVLEQNPAITQPSTYTGREARDLDTELKLGVPYQDLFYHDASGDLVGRSYERCDNLLRVSFLPAPRKPGTVRITLCPVVRSLRERVVAIGDVNTTTYQFVQPEQVFDLNLTVDVPLDAFLVVAPSPESKWPSSLGSNFLVDQGAAEQTETLLIFRPVVYRQKVDGAAVTPKPAAPPTDAKP